MPATPIPSYFTEGERAVAAEVQKDALNFANDNDIEAGAYMAPVAALVLRGDLSDAALASMAREVLQQYLRDTKGHAEDADRELEQAVEDAEAEWQQRLDWTLEHLLPRNGAVL